ncbi:Putative ribonuclease H protein At1g65750 [Linum perenne]
MSSGYCPSTAQVWDALGFRNTNPFRRGTYSTDWLKFILTHDKALDLGIACWYMWKSRNDRVFSESAELMARAVARIMAWTGIVKGTLERNALFGNVNPRQVVSPVAWDPGPPSWTVLNSDGSVLQPSGKAVAGGLLRDEMGQCSAAYALNLGICSITRAELRGMIFGLQLAWELGHRRVVAQLYSVVAVILLKVGGDITDQYAAEVLQFWELHNRDWKVQIRDIYREANKAADFLASRGHSLVLGNHIVPISDSSLGFYLRYDCIGIFEDRLISINS